MASYVLFRDKSGFLLVNGSHRVYSFSLDDLILALTQPEIYGYVYGTINVPDSFSDDRVPLTKKEREYFIEKYMSNYSN